MMWYDMMVFGVACMVLQDRACYTIYYGLAWLGVVRLA